MGKYKVWNKADPILTPVGEIFTADQWIERHPIAGLPSITVVCAGGEINGAFFGTLGQMVDIYEQQGCDFSLCNTDREKLDAIEMFENNRNNPDMSRVVSNEELTATSLASIAASLEYQNMITLEDVEV